MAIFNGLTPEGNRSSSVWTSFPKKWIYSTSHLHTLHLHNLKH